MGSKPEDEKKDETMEVEEEKPVELTEDEKKIWFPRYDIPDLSRQVLAKNFANFSLPTKEEGFDEIRFAWQKESKCAEHLKAWLLENKKTQRAEDLEPSDWFKGKYAEWTKNLKEWREKQTEAEAVEASKAKKRALEK